MITVARSLLMPLQFPPLCPSKTLLPILDSAFPHCDLTIGVLHQENPPFALHCYWFYPNWFTYKCFMCSIHRHLPYCFSLVPNEYKL